MTSPPPHGGGFSVSRFRVHVNRAAVLVLGVIGMTGGYFAGNARSTWLRVLGLVMAAFAVVVLCVPIIAGVVLRLIDRRREARWMRSH